VFSFRLTDDFVASYKDKKVPWGYTDAGGNSVGEITFMRTYSRLREDGSKESWVDVCRRVIEGMYSIQKDHCKTNRLPWNGQQAQSSAQEAFDRLFNLKWTPPGRGLWMMGTPFVMEHRNSAALQNCAFVSTADMTKLDPSAPFVFLMEASMLGVGVGFDTKGADKEFQIYSPSGEEAVIVVADTREGWVESTAILLNSYLRADQPIYTFDFLNSSSWNPNQNIWWNRSWIRTS
jgi:ribonucleoside-triphosphate reductase